MANITDVTNILPTSHEGYVDNLSASISSEASTVPVNSASAYLDGDVAVLTVDPGTPEEATFTGTKASSPDRFVNCKWTEGNIGAGHASGSAVVDYVSATHYNLLAKALKGILNQDGSYKSSVLESILNVNKRTEDLFGDFLVQAPITDTTGLAQTYGEVIAYIGGARVRVDSGEIKVLTATSDNYVTLDNLGAINVIAVAVGSPQPALPANSLWLGKYTTDASAITDTDETLRVTSPIATKSIQNEAVTPAKRSGGYKIGVIPGSTFGSTGIKSITGVGFKPRLVEFEVLPTNSTSSLIIEGRGSMDENGTQYTIAYSSSTSGQARRAETNLALVYMSQTTAITAAMGFEYESMDEDGFSIDVKASNPTFDVAYKAYA